MRGRFLDDYWMNEPVSGITNANGMVSFVHDGLACVGAVAFLADSAIPVIARGPKGTGQNNRNPNRLSDSAAVRNTSRS